MWGNTLYRVEGRKGRQFLQIIPGNMQGPVKETMMLTIREMKLTTCHDTELAGG